VTKEREEKIAIVNKRTALADFQSFLKDLDERVAALEMQYYHEERIADLEDCVLEYSQCGSPNTPCPNKNSLESRVAALESGEPGPESLGIRIKFEVNALERKHHERIAALEKKTAVLEQRPLKRKE
jgi:hypothetical protein